MSLKPYYGPHAGITIYHGDCREILPQFEGFDLILTDPPYPDYYTELYGFREGDIEMLDRFSCRQFVFWSNRADFPLSFTAVHIWNKNPSNHGAQYERIFERNGGSHFKVFTQYMVNSTVAASFRELYTSLAGSTLRILLPTLAAFGRFSLGFWAVCENFIGDPV